MEITLKRVVFSDDGVQGVLVNGNTVVCLTLEEEWKDNSKGISCIPVGSYLCRRVNTKGHGITYEVQDVPGRDAILFHSGNTEEDTEGCILTGKEFGYVKVKDEDTGELREKQAVLNSKSAFAYLMSVLNDRETFVLHVKAC